jgi:hypothetical protein
LKQVSTLQTHFKDDANRASHQRTPSGFTTLDMTGVFMLAERTQKPFRVQAPDASSPLAKSRFRLTTGRTEVHYLQYTVDDAFEVDVQESGLLARLSRSFYTQRLNSSSGGISRFPTIERPAACRRRPDRASKISRPHSL